LDDAAYVAELNRRAGRAAQPFHHFDAERARNADPRFYLPTTDPRHNTVGHAEYITEAAMPLAKFVGTYTGEGISIDVDMRQRKMPKGAIQHSGMEPVYNLYVRAPMFPTGITLVPVSGARFRSERSSDAIFLEFEIVNGKTNGLTLEPGEG